jgi:sugar/nucleoside kinase (ribokinase family)
LTPCKDGRDAPAESETEYRELVSPSALFAGLCTLDLIQQVDHVPAANEKMTAGRQVVAAGGPAANAAATFAHLGGSATLVTGLGDHPLAAGAKADLAQLGVRLVDLAAGDPAPPAVSCVLVTAGTGTRAVVSRNAIGQRLRVPDDLDRVTVLDGGSWKEHLPSLLPMVDVAICSADLHPPGGEPTLAYLAAQGVVWRAVTDGARPVRWAGPVSAGEIAVPPVEVVDTTGAGDVFHGAFCHAVAAAGALDEAAFAAALRRAAAVAAESCRWFGTREWMRVGGLE